MDIKEFEISGCFLVTLDKFTDIRGCFVKTYHETYFSNLGIKFEIKEEYYSVSNAGVIRGMHFQVPPYDHIKMVYCIKGAVFDAFVDLREESPTYLQACQINLSDSNANVLVLPKGIAHGFCALENGSIMVYKTSSEYSPEHDSGILWNSCGINWPITADPNLLSERDRGFPTLKYFINPL